MPVKDWFSFLTQDFSGGKQRHIRGLRFVRLITSVGTCVCHNKHLCSALNFANHCYKKDRVESVAELWSYVSILPA